MPNARGICSNSVDSRNKRGERSTPARPMAARSHKCRLDNLRAATGRVRAGFKTRFPGGRPGRGAVLAWELRLSNYNVGEISGKNNVIPPALTPEYSNPRRESDDVKGLKGQELRLCRVADGVHV